MMKHLGSCFFNGVQWSKMLNGPGTCMASPLFSRCPVHWTLFVKALHIWVNNQLFPDFLFWINCCRSKAAADHSPLTKMETWERSAGLTSCTKVEAAQHTGVQFRRCVILFCFAVCPRDWQMKSREFISLERIFLSYTCDLEDTSNPYKLRSKCLMSESHPCKFLLHNLMWIAQLTVFAKYEACLACWTLALKSWNNV